MDAALPDFVVVLPVKPPAFGKSRLRGLPDPGRRDLAEAFALDTAAACLSVARVRAVLAATDDAEFASRLATAGCATIPDGDTTGLNAALRQAVAEAARCWPAHRPVALLADLPALRADELATALGSLTPGAASYVADADGTGTTLYSAPYGLFDPAFGVGSAAAHLAAGAVPVVGDLATVRRDVDNLHDLRQAAELGVGPATERLVAQLGLA